MYDNTMMGLEVAIMILRAIKGVCSNRSSCVGCCFLYDHAAEKMSQSLEEALKEGDHSGT